jgi:cobalt/nickel transport system permease protein
MHVSDGVLPPGVWAPALAAAGAAVALASRRLDERRIPEVAVLTAIFFAAALIHVPVPPTSIHLSLGGLLGIILGWLSLPAVFVALLFQYVFLRHGGITTLGVNTLTMGAGSIASWLIFRSLRRAVPGGGAPLAAFVAAAGGAIASAAVFVSVMALGGEGLVHVALLCLVPGACLAVLEGLVTASTIGFLLKARPELVPGAVRPVPADRGERRAGTGAVAVSVACLVLAPAPARAHDIEAEARVAGGAVRVEASFSDGVPVRGARVTVREAGPGAGGVAAVGSVLAEGVTDDGGWFQFAPAREADLLVVIEDPLGHRAELEIPASRLRGALGAGGAAGAADAAKPIASTAEGLAPVWIRAAAGVLAIAVLAAGAYAALRWRRPGGP